MTEQSFTPQDLFPAEQVRLAEVTAYNWGPFGPGVDHLGHTARINPDGTLITGETGAGKSTIVDALQVIFQSPGRVSFNVAAAQNARRDRDLVSYVRGKYRSDEVEDRRNNAGYARPQQVTSIVRALFTQGDIRYTCAAVFCVNSSSCERADVNGCYLTANRDISIAEIRAWLQERDLGALRSACQKDSGVTFHARFDSYSVDMMGKLHIESRNASKLLSRALGLKKIDNLTNLMRDLVLEPVTAVDSARAVVSAFQNSRETYERLLLARQQEAALLPLLAHQEKLQALNLRVERIGSLSTHLRPRIATRLALHWGPELLGREVAHRSAEELLLFAGEVEVAAGDRLTRAATAHAETGGGRVELFSRDIEALDRELEVAEANRAQLSVSLANLGRSGPPQNALEFHELLAWVKAEADAAGQGEQEARASANQSFVMSERRVAARETLKAELTVARSQRESNIHSDLARTRADIAQAVGAGAERLPFAAELVQVKASEKEWHGAIERAMGRKRLTMLVPEDLAKGVSEYVNSHHLGLDFFHVVVGRHAGPAEWGANSYLSKLDWKPHEHRDWLKQWLASEDMACAESVQDMRQTPYSFTREGLMQGKRGSYSKRDRQRVDNPLAWMTGFSNVERVKILAERLTLADAEVQESRDAYETAKRREEGTQVRRTLLDGILRLKWTQIDSESISVRCAALVEERDDYLGRTPGLAVAEAELASAKAAAEQARCNRDQAKDHERQLQASVSAARTQLEMMTHESGAVPDELVDELDMMLGATINPSDGIDRAQNRVMVELKNLQDAASKQRLEVTNECVRIMTAFRGMGRLDVEDWGASEGSIPRYLELLEQLQREGLPRLVDEFKSRLAKFTDQSLGSLASELSDARQEIEDRITTINAVLERTELRPGTRLVIQARVRLSQHYHAFKDAVAASRAHAASLDDEARYTAMKVAVDILEKATDPQSVDKPASQSLLDPRHQFEFVANEVDKETGEVRDSWSSSSGKSGGEKESFAGTIVAASLAYVLTPQGASHPTYCTVFLDEAFSNTSSQYSRRVLQAFKEMKLHLNLITPLKNLDLARHHARSIILVSKSSSEHTSRLRDVQWEYLAEMKKAKARAEADVQ